jgi:hypothetical protein
MSMSLILAVLSFLTALLPLAERSVVTVGHLRAQRLPQQAQPVHTAQKPGAPPEVGQPNVVFYRGEWWKYENGVWLVWRQNSNQVAQGGYANVVR